MLLTVIFACTDDTDFRMYVDSTWTDTDTGEIGSAYSDVSGLNGCMNGFVRLPRNNADVNDTVDAWDYSEIREIVYGDAEADRGFGGFFPVIFVGEGEDPIDREEGWYVDGTVDTNYDNGVRVEYYQYPDRTEETQSFTLVCPGKDW